MDELITELELDWLNYPNIWRLDARGQRQQRAPSLYTRHDNRDFRCLACGRPVSAQIWISGVHHRNHCPYCLWSRHLDLHQAGDRLSACKAGMQPMGLTKKQRNRYYAAANTGELMLVHQCVECSKLSINRLAADDRAEALMEIFNRSLSLGRRLQAQLNQEKIQLLRDSDLPLVRTQLDGRA